MYKRRQNNKFKRFSERRRAKQTERNIKREARPAEIERAKYGRVVG